MGSKGEGQRGEFDTGRAKEYRKHVYRITRPVRMKGWDEVEGKGRRAMEETLSRVIYDLVL